VQDEGDHGALGGGEARHAVAAGAGGAEVVGEEGDVEGGEDREGVGHGGGRWQGGRG
jgi:hypothetical protein